MGDLQTVYHAIKVLGAPPEQVPDRYETIFPEEESIFAAISQSLKGSEPLIFAEVAVSVKKPTQANLIVKKFVNFHNHIYGSSD